MSPSEDINQAIKQYGPPTDRFVLRLGKEDGKFQPWHLTKDMFEDDFQSFLACLNLNYWHNKVTERMKEYNKTKTAQKRTVRKVKKELEKKEKKLTKSKEYGKLVEFLEG